jgi:hypothetical protein
MARVRPGIGWSVVGARRACSRMPGTCAGASIPAPSRAFLRGFGCPPVADNRNPDNYSFWADMYWS